ncbi:MAG: hypothetical protein WCL06_03740 [Bacteroidota bacterium]
MKKTVLIALVILISSAKLVAGDLNNDIIALAKIYKNFMFRNEPTESTFNQINNISSKELVDVKKIIREMITTNNKLSTDEFLKLPDESTLKYLLIVRNVDWNMLEDKPKDNITVINDLIEKQINRYELIDCYYGMLFAGIGNKNQPFDMSKTNFEMYKYNLKDDTEKAIFFFEAMSLCGINIWGYMNIANPPNYKAAMENINKFPKFDGQPYYQYTDFGFEDFKMEIEKGKGKVSYKTYYLNKFYDTLLSHLECLSQNKKDDESRTDLLLGSILREKKYYQYSKKTKILESLFTEVKK